MQQKPTFESLLAKPIWQMTGEEFLQLNELNNRGAGSTAQSAGSVQYAHGIAELSQMIGCCQSTVYALKKEGVLDGAIVSQIGRRIIFDADKARALADEYQRVQRESRRDDH